MNLLTGKLGTMAKETFYFSHDYNSRGDTKMVALRKKMKMKGVGIYWCIIEMLYEEKGYLKLSEIDNIAYDLRVKRSEIEMIIKSFELFQYDSEKFWSESAISRLKKREEKSNEAKKSAQKRWDKANQDANALPPQCYSDASAMQPECDSNAIKESKVKESKVKEIEHSRAIAVEICSIFSKTYKEPQERLPAEVTFYRDIDYQAKQLSGSWSPDVAKTQIQAYRQYCDLTGRQRIGTAYKVSETLITSDWEALLKARLTGKEKAQDERAKILVAEGTEQFKKQQKSYMEHDRSMLTEEAFKQKYGTV